MGSPVLGIVEHGDQAEEATEDEPA